MKRSPLKRKSSLIRCKSALRRSRSTGKPTKAESARMEALSHMDCVACVINALRGDFVHGPWWYASDVHHLLSGGRRRGHADSICLCPWHHRSMPPEPGMPMEEAIRKYGPTLERQRMFRDYYGTDDELLSMVNKILDATGGE